MKNPVILVRELFAKLPRETFRYVVAGAFTTLIDLGLFKFLTALGVDDKLSNGISIAAAILFAYIINKLYVFKRHTGSFGALAAEFLKFLGGRALTGLLELFGYPVLLRLIGGHETIAKGVTIVIVFIFNYIISKVFVFSREDSGEADT